MTSPAAPAFATTLRAVRRRQRGLAVMLAWARVGLPVGLLVTTAAVLAHRLFGWSVAGALLGLAPGGLAIAIAAARAHPLRRAARAVDRHYGLHDLLGNALELSAAPARDGATAAFTRLLIESADRQAETVDPARVVRLRPPRPSSDDALPWAMLGLAMLVPVTTDAGATAPETAVATAPAAEPATGLALGAAVEPLRADLRALTGPDDEATRAADASLAILDAVEAGTLGREEALERLAALEAELERAASRFEDELGLDPGVLEAAVARIAEALQREQLTAGAAEALAQGEPDAARDQLEAASEQAQADPAGAGAEYDRALSGLERALERSTGSAERTTAAMKELERRLRKPGSDAGDPEAERRLRRDREQLERLRRKHERERAAERALEQLRRQSQKARAGDDRGAKKQRQQQLAEGLRRAAQGATGGRRLDEAKSAVQEAQSAVRRAGKPSAAGGRRDRQMKQFSKAAKGKRDGGKPGPTLLVEGELGGDRPSEGLAMAEPGQGPGEGRQGEGEGEGDEGDGDGDGASDPAEGRAGEARSAMGGDGIGSGSSDPLAEPQERDVRLRDVGVKARHGRGATRAEVIRTSSQDGFAGEAYRAVFGDYHGFARSVLDNDATPPAERRRVRRYFQLIAPRTQHDDRSP